MNKQKILEDFIEEQKKDENVVAIILFGSFARGNARPDSDIDLLIILKSGFLRRAEYFKGQAFEIIYTSEAAAIQYWHNHMHDAFGLWSVAKLLFDRDGTGMRLETIGKKITNSSPSLFDHALIPHLQFDLQDSIKAAKKIYEDDPATAFLLLNKKATDIQNVFFDLHSIWHPAPKQQLQTIGKKDRALFQLLNGFYTIPSFQEKVALLEKITTHILQTRPKSAD